MPLGKTKSMSYEIIHPPNERTFKFFLQTAATRDTQSADEFFKVDETALIGIENVENVLGEFSWITEREELLVYPAEFCLVEMA